MFRLLLALFPLIKFLALNGDGGGGAGGGEGNQPAGGAPAGDPAGDPPQVPPAPPADPGYPQGVAVADMTAEQQAAYWRDHSRKHEQRNKELLALADGDPEKLKQIIREHGELRQKTMTEHERDLEQAREEGRRLAITEAGTAAVEALINGAVDSGRVERARADSILSVLDRSKFLTEEGRVDTAKVNGLIESIATPAKGDSGSGPSFDLGQGHRPGAGATSKSEAGLEEARRRGYVTASQ